MPLEVAGCRNTGGTTCYLNAGLQALASSVVLTNHVLQLRQLVEGSRGERA
jgi:ubiquitin C-terminal hydrolase